MHPVGMRLENVPCVLSTIMCRYCKGTGIYEAAQNGPREHTCIGVDGDPRVVAGARVVVEVPCPRVLHSAAISNEHILEAPTVLWAGMTPTPLVNHFTLPAAEQLRADQDKRDRMPHSVCHDTRRVLNMQ